ncbi:hypothetical protein ONS95_008197 [Cadophora gregata]|uniref:uncharacterized protein n=1 Tax=Cadophora gregata TaxID=51156 RepID=UPI0026DB1EEE|nr:uncharacterized protein ONS95_008197 [Cadophora gregata]KAK0100233.1 hypothetical protein ONS96_007516 [Cadophora gregata f. sp. sojae]KAK0126609.1 hypothetical protein ONS95_008197 [Cadophora gregata]
MSDTESSSKDTGSSCTEANKRKCSTSREVASKNKKTELPTFSDGKSLVTFIVGPDPNPTEFLIHKEIICHYSEVLATAFNSAFKEGQTQTYRVEDTTERAFRLLMQWLYSQKLTLIQLQPDYCFDEAEGAETELEDSEDMSLVEVWVIADKFGIPSLQNAALQAIQTIFEMSYSLIPSHTFHYVFDNTSEVSPLRDYMVATCVQYAMPAHLDNEFKGDFPRGLLLELSRIFLKGSEHCEPEELDVSKFFVQ